jgi:DNA-binding transcriptional LysR family regulator
VEEKLENVAVGRGIAVLPLSVARFYTRPGITHVAVRDLPSNQVSLAWHSTRRSALIPEFAALFTGS